MPDPTTRSRPDEVRWGPGQADRPDGPAKLGSLLAEAGRRAALTEEEWAVFVARDGTPGRPVSLE